MRSFSSKILLFGEYGILVGSMGLAIPWYRYSGRLVFPGEEGLLANLETRNRSNRRLLFLLEYLQRNISSSSFLKVGKFARDLSKNLWFDSNIPHAYGLGSSGALTAAIFDRYARANARKKPLSEIRMMLADIEKFFHGTSSGLDPLVSLVNKPIIIDRNGEALTLPEDTRLFTRTDKKPENEQTTKERISEATFFLIDTKTESKTGNLVNWFRKQYQTADFRQEVENTFIPAINQAATGLSNQNHNQIMEASQAISAFQVNYMKPAIPPHFIDFFNEGLNTGLFFLKLCGSGGGGFMMGVTQHPDEARHYFEKHNYPLQIIHNQTL